MILLVVKKQGRGGEDSCLIQENVLPFVLRSSGSSRSRGGFKDYAAACFASLCRRF